MANNEENTTMFQFCIKFRDLSSVTWYMKFELVYVALLVDIINLYLSF